MYTVADIMQPIPQDVELDPALGIVPELSVWECAVRLAHTAARRIPVVREGRVIGMVSEMDILRILEGRGGAD